MLRFPVVAIGLVVSLVFTACQVSKANKAPKPFAEAESLVCPPDTERVENHDSTFPEIYCMSKSGKLGPWLEFDENGIIKTRAEYVDDKMEGLWTSYHPNGSIDAQGTMHKNMRVGQWKQWYVDHTPRSEKDYKNNVYDGQVRLYYRNGTLMVEGKYVNDLEEGPWKVYTPEGELARECRLDAGEEKDCIVHIKDFKIKSRQVDRRIIITEDS